ncbi:hypothetical protein CTI12_AA428540 [Artemisia annua]|uniref:Uncharacterized protein n=1 Tax=Artemisia annua TaxID=35608 RepID=A0A2U1M247_ARTAN|nr:hypothetical protein CTI12_AA428540 [Artemisia annua]
MISAVNTYWQNHIHQRHSHKDHLQSTSNQYRRCLGRDLGPGESEESFEWKHVEIVMDAMKEFSPSR